MCSLMRYHWEGMLLSFLATETLHYPFLNIQGLMQDTNYIIAIYPGSVHEELFKNSTDSFARDAWYKRILPHLDDYKIYMNNNDFNEYDALDVLNLTSRIALFYNSESTKYKDNFHFCFLLEFNNNFSINYYSVTAF